MISRRRLVELCLGGASVALVAMLPRVAGAAGPPPTSAELIVLLGTNGDGGAWIDPQIGDLPQLNARPLNRYNSFRLLDRKTLSLTLGTPTSYTLPDGSTLSVLLEHVAAGDAGDARFTFREELSGGHLRRPMHVEVTSTPNDHVFVGGMAYKGGALYMGITIQP